jgi:ATP-dependent exoDNAse (exonuclease V) alpha subunit
MFHFDIKPVSRAKGQTAPAAAAYRAGERIRNERTGETHNHSRRKDVTHTEIFLPSQFGDAPMEWARDRSRLWNAAESAERRRNSRVAREFQVALPAELSAQQRLTLARTFAREVSDRYGVAVDLALHDPKPSGDPRQFHAHLLMTTREITREGLGAKAGLDMQSAHRFRMGLSDHKTEYVAVRERWASLTNAAFKDANIDIRVDHRTLAAQGIDREPVVHVPLEFYRQQTKGLDRDGIRKMREDYKAWIESSSAPASREQSAKPQLQQTASQAQDAWVRAPLNEAQSQRGQTRSAAEAMRPRFEQSALQEAPPPVGERSNPSVQAQPSEPRASVAPRTLAEIRRQAVKNWLQLRSRGTESPGNEPARQRAKEATSTRAQGEDLGK